MPAQYMTTEFHIAHSQSLFPFITHTTSLQSIKQHSLKNHIQLSINKLRI